MVISATHFVLWVVFFIGGYLFGFLTYWIWPIRVTVWIGGIWIILQNYDALLDIRHPILWMCFGVLWAHSSWHRRMNN